MLINKLLEKNIIDSLIIEKNQKFGTLK